MRTDGIVHGSLDHTDDEQGHGQEPWIISSGRYHFLFLCKTEGTVQGILFDTA